MKSRAWRVLARNIFMVGVVLSAPWIFPQQFCGYAQGGNTISGYVFGVDRRPVADLHIELNDDYRRTVARSRTNGSGYYSFSGVGSGRFTIVVYTFGTDYEEQESSLEIVNIASTNSSGAVRLSGFSREQRDIYLRLRRGVTPAGVAVFVQADIPKEAVKKYEKAVADLDGKRDVEGVAGLISAIEIFPRYYAALERLGTEYVRLGQVKTFQAAELLLAIAVEVNPRGLRSWYGLAYSRYSLGNNARALEAVQKAVELNSSWPDALVLHGLLLRRAEKYAEAEKQLLKAVELSKDTIPQAHWELALLYGNNLKRYADAAKELKLFLKNQPDTKNADNIRKLIAEFETKAAKT